MPVLQFRAINSAGYILFNNYTIERGVDTSIDTDYINSDGFETLIREYEAMRLSISDVGAFFEASGGHVPTPSGNGRLSFSGCGGSADTTTLGIVDQFEDYDTIDQIVSKNPNRIYLAKDTGKLYRYDEASDTLVEIGAAAAELNRYQATVISNGQNIFTLTPVPPAGSIVIIVVNGVEYGGNANITISGNQATWSGPFSISTTDNVEFIY